MFTKTIQYLILLLFFLLLPVSVLAGNCTGYAFGENIGWINFNPSQGDGVTVTDTALTGYAWSENTGWIHFNPTYGGVTNDGDGNLSGYAWGENIGWINFNPSYGGVTIDPSTGDFSGYAWSENAGWINFSCSHCNVNTTWRKKTGVSPSALPFSVSPTNSISINQGAEITNQREVTLYLSAKDAEKMAICNNKDFINCPPEEYQETKDWLLTEGEGQKTVYALFINWWGVKSNIVSDSIILKEEIPTEEEKEEEISGVSKEKEETLPEKPTPQPTKEEILQKMVEVLTKLIQLYTQLIQLLRG